MRGSKDDEAMKHHDGIAPPTVTITCIMCHATMQVPIGSTDALVEQRGWGVGRACSRGYGNKGCMKCYVCPNCLKPKEK